MLVPGLLHPRAGAIYLALGPGINPAFECKDLNPAQKDLPLAPEPLTAVQLRQRNSPSLEGLGALIGSYRKVDLDPSSREAPRFF